VFHDVAYKASCREDITAGIDEFLQQVLNIMPVVFFVEIANDFWSCWAVATGLSRYL
jgi:hypothetical protein